MTSIKTTGLLILGIILTALVFTGCGVTASQSAVSEKSAKAEYHSSLQNGSSAEGAANLHKVIGNVETGETIQKVSLLNLTGKDINGFSIRTSEAEPFGENMLSEGDRFILDEVRDLYYDMAPPKKVASVPEEQGIGNYTEVKYDAQITLSDGKVYILHDLPFTEFENARLLLQEGILFLEYVSPWTGEEVITRTDEIAAKAADEQARKEKLAVEEKAAEDAKRAEEEQAAAQAQAEADAAAAQQAQAEADAAAAWQAQQAQLWEQQPQQTGNDAGCVGNAGLVY